LIKHRNFAPSANIRDPRFALIQFLRAEKPCGSAKNKVTIIFDGYSSETNLRGLEFEVIFSCETSADERIKRIVESEHSPRNLIIVSDDRQIRDFVKLCGAVSLGIAEFITPPVKKTFSHDPDLSKADLTFDAARKINEELKKIWLKE